VNPPRTADRDPIGQAFAGIAAAINDHLAEVIEQAVRTGVLTDGQADDVLLISLRDQGQADDEAAQARLARLRGAQS
jgi:hypothetical protein